MAKNPLELANQIETNPFNVDKTSSMFARGNPKDVFKHIGDNYRLIKMSPNDYYKITSSILGTTPQELMEQRQKVANDMSVDDMRKKMRSGTKFDTPWINLIDRGEDKTTRTPYFQEGLHRMLAAGQEYGMDTKMPVYLGYESNPWNEIESMSMDDFIKHYNDTRSQRYNAYMKKKKEEDERFEKEYKQDVAKYYNLPLEQVTPELIKKYDKEMDNLFIEDLNY